MIKRPFCYLIGLSFFQCKRELRRCLGSVEWADKVLAIDGRYKGYEGKTALSTDGSRELVKSFKNTSLIDAPDLPEVKKRQIYLDKCAEYANEQDAILIVLDSDEFIKGDIDAFKLRVEQRITESVNIYYIDFQKTKKEDNKIVASPRLIYRPSEMEYTRKHTTLKRKDARHWFESGYDKGSTIKGIEIIHDQSLRSWGYNEKREQYQGRLFADEEKLDPLMETKEEKATRLSKELGIAHADVLRMLNDTNSW